MESFTVIREDDGSEVKVFEHREFFAEDIMKQGRQIMERPATLRTAGGIGVSPHRHGRFTIHYGWPKGDKRAFRKDE